jgi:hypothetical protein
LYAQGFSNGDAAWDANNTAVGYWALHDNAPTSTTNGINNTALGASALEQNTTGHRNTASGANALYANTTGNRNTASGSNALYANTTGNYNTASGRSALSANTTGEYNTASGSGALYANTTGSYNTAIGYFADVASENLINATAIGYNAEVDGSNRVRIGNGNVTQIGGNVAWSNLSDRRGKEDIADIPFGLEFIRALKPVVFKLKNGNGRMDLGFIAQDIEDLIGEEYNLLGIGATEERKLSLRYTDLIAPMVNAIQEQQEIIDNQDALINQLQDKQAALNHRLAKLEALLTDRGAE